MLMTGKRLLRFLPPGLALVALGAACLYSVQQTET